MSSIRTALKALADNRLNLLIVFAPVAWVLNVIAPHSQWVFLAAAVSLVPLAGVIGLGTEELAERGPRPRQSRRSSARRRVVWARARRVRPLARTVLSGDCALSQCKSEVP